MSITVTRTEDLTMNDFVDWRGDRRQVVELADSGQPALFGTGNAWYITLQTESGVLVPMTSAASDKWNRI